MSFMPVLEAYFSASLCRWVVCSIIDFRDDDELAARIQDSEYFAHTRRQVRPSEVRSHGHHKIEHATRERELRYRTMPNLDTAHTYSSCICFPACGDALLGIINAVNLSVRSGRR